MARPIRALELRRTHVHHRRPRAVVTRIRAISTIRVVAALAALAGPSLACADNAFAPTQVGSDAGSATAITHWRIQSSAKAQQSGGEVSAADYSTKDWSPVSGRATVR